MLGFIEEQGVEPVRKNIGHQRIPSVSFQMFLMLGFVEEEGGEPVSENIGHQSTNPFDFSPVCLFRCFQMLGLVENICHQSTNQKTGTPSVGGPGSRI